ncbi:MAG: hypothetical protein R3349_08370 [Geminicoccaceae bacterium]|nr:hypothetical protein [Geminicoccaceae bacterium]
MSSSAPTLNLPPNRSLTVTVTPAPRRLGLSVAILKRPPRSTMVGLALVATTLVVCLGEVAVPVLGTAQLDTVYKFASGGFLLGYILLQWNLFAHREKNEQPALMAKWYRRHKLLGAFAPVAFLLHTLSFGTALLLLLSATFLIVVTCGFLNRDLLNIQSRRFWQAWTVFHVGSAFALYALIALHVWTALSFHA